MAFMFENLQVYEKAVDFADRIAGLTGSFPRGFYFLVDQLNRASRSIPANLAEGAGRFTKADRKNFFRIARESAQECVPLLEVARRRGFIDDTPHAQFKTALEEIARMTSGLINGLDNRSAPSSTTISAGRASRMHRKNAAACSTPPAPPASPG